MAADDRTVVSGIQQVATDLRAKSLTGSWQVALADIVSGLEYAFSIALCAREDTVRLLYQPQRVTQEQEGSVGIYDMQRSYWVSTST